ncbi:MAG TPA: AAA family ATPase, partial [Thermoleophilaceae bacterium]|nr:AAA family ATPase [Thermoleophilaceae bacterium]
LDGATRGRSASLLGFGEPGIGKSALAAQAVEMALDRGMRVLRARGVEAETDIPFAGLSELLAPVLDHRRQLPPVQAEALGAALALEPAAGAHDRFAVAAALLSLLAAAADEQPLLAVVDDAQWVDDASLDSLLFAARRLENEGVVILLGTRPEPDRGLLGRGMFEFELQPLGDQDARRLLDRAAGEPLADDAADRLLRSAAGNPLALLELPGAPQADTAGAPGPPAPGARVEAAFRATLAQLPPATREALTVVAADEASAPVTVAAALDQLGLPPDALAAAERARVIQVTRGQLQFRHPLLRSVAYHQAGAEQRRRVHAALAVATGQDDDPVARAWHLAAAATGRDRRVADELEGAAASARARGAVTSAAHALSRSAELTPDPTDRARRLLAAARDWASTERPAESAELAAQALELTDEPLLRADLQRVRGEVMIRMGQFDAAHDLLTVAAEQVAPLDERRAAEMYLAASVRHRASGSYGQMRRDAERARELAGLDHPDVARFADLVLAHTLVVSGVRLRGDALIGLHEEALVSALARDEVNIELLTSPAHASMWAGRRQRAERIARLLVGRARQSSAPGALIFPLGIQSQLHYRAGRWRAAYAGAEEASGWPPTPASWPGGPTPPACWPRSRRPWG